MENLLEIASPSELMELHFNEYKVDEEGLKLIRDLYNKASDDSKKRSLAQYYLMKGNLAKAETLLRQITEPNLVRSLNQEIIEYKIIKGIKDE